MDFQLFLSESGRPVTIFAFRLVGYKARTIDGSWEVHNNITIKLSRPSNRVIAIIALILDLGQECNS